MQIGARLVRTPAELDIAYQCHHDWYVAANLLEPAPDGRYTDGYTSRADYFIIYKGESLNYPQALGLIRIIHEKPFVTFEKARLFPAFAYLEDLPTTDICEISGLCWHPRMARQAIPHLLRPIYYYYAQRQRRYAVCILSQKIYPFFQKLHLPMQVIGEPQFLLEDWRIPLLLNALDVVRELPIHAPALWAITSLPVEE